MSTVRRAEPSELPACLDVRHEVFVVGQRVPEALEVDGLDEACTHFLALADDGRAIGAARLRITEDGRAKAERVAVRATHRGQGLGAKLMDALEAEARARGFAEVVLSAQAPVIPFYEGRGYVPEGPIYDEAGIPHRKMRLALGGRR